jgi:hypothetical protein
MVLSAKTAHYQEYAMIISTNYYNKEQANGNSSREKSPGLDDQQMAPNDGCNLHDDQHSRFHTVSRTVYYRAVLGSTSSQ